MGHYLILSVFWCFVAFVFALVIRAFILKYTAKPDDRAIFETVNTVTVHTIKPHDHEWRHITDYVKQCRIRECSKVEFGSDVPAGMAEYVTLMTSRQARIDPNGEASHYSELDERAWGPKCPACDRVIGFPWTIARGAFDVQYENELVGSCPYCQTRLQFLSVDKRWATIDPLPKQKGNSE